MNYSKAQILNLKQIYKSESEGVHAKDFVDENGVKLKDSKKIIKELIELDLIETEIEKDVYYLTYEGVCFVESMGNKKNRYVSPDPFFFFDNVVDKLNTYPRQNLLKSLFFGGMLLYAIILTIQKYYFPQEPKPIYQFENIHISIPSEN